MSPGDQNYAALLAELHGERAHALGRIARGMEKALAALRDFDAGVIADPEKTREELVAEAAERVWFYVVQRDVLGMHGHDEALRAYDVPDEVRFRMGPRRRTA
jgi:hypothetical protein